MNLRQTLVAIFLLAAWLPVASHCLLEQAGWLFAANDCCSQADAGSSKSEPCDEGCCAVESAVYLSSGKIISCAPLAIVPSTIFIEPKPAVLSHVAISPPELPRSWQFTCRAALPPRAPDFVS